MRLILLLLFLLPGILKASSTESDSLIQVYKLETNDSLKARACLKLGDYYENIRVDEALKWGDKAIYHARKFKNKLFLVKVLNYSSTFYNRKGNYKHQVKLGLEAMKIAEDNKFFEQQGSVAGNIGSAYIRLEDKDQAVHWLLRSIELKKKYSSRAKWVISIGNLGTFYYDIGEYEAAVKQHELALQIRRGLGEDEKMAITLGNLAGCHMMLDNFKEAESLFKEAYSIRKISNDNYGINKLMLDFSWLFERKKETRKSIAYADSAYNMAIEYNYDEFHHDAALQLGTMHNLAGNSVKGYTYMLEAYNLWKDLHDEEATQNLNELRTQYETEKVEGENLLLRKDSEIQDLNSKTDKARINSQRVIITSVVVLVVILAILVLFLNKWNRDKFKRNSLLNEQKELVEKKNEEILASIQYAKRIQTAILPQKEKIKQCLPDSFVMYKPKDVVAGDFYWLEDTGNEILIAAADCTGHGVPGAMVSVVCNNGLNRSVREYGLRNPSDILDMTRSIVVEEFEKSADEVQDGMDIALCSIKGDILKYAGAHNPLWLVRNGELIEYKANKQPIGQFDKPTPYQTHTIDLQKDDCIYLFSDGFVDQFGGPKNKKYKTANFKKLLVEINGFSIDEQHVKLEESFNVWKGQEEQLDDVCVIGIRF